MTPNLKRSEMNLSEKIDLYLDGLLTHEERRAIEKKIEDDPEFAMQVQDLKKMEIIISNLLQYPDSEITGIQSNSQNFPNQPGKSVSPVLTPASYQKIPNASEAALNPPEQLTTLQELEIKDDLYKYHDHFPPGKESGEEKLSILLRANSGQSKEKPHLHLMFFLNIAASIGLLIVLTAGIVYVIKEHRMNKNLDFLFTNYFHPEDDAGLSPIIAEAGFSSFNDVKLRFNHKGDISKSASRNNEWESVDLLLQGILFIEPGEYDAAINNLLIAMESGDPQLSEAAKWYYSLLLIKKKNLPKAIIILREISTSASSYSTRAKLLVESLSPG